MYITSADEIEEVMFLVAFVCLFVSLFVCPDNNLRTVIASNMRFSGLHYGPWVESERFGDNPDIRPDIRSDKISLNSTDLPEPCWLYV